MGLIKNKTDKPYLIGRATAIVESCCNVPDRFSALVAVSPLGKLSYWLNTALTLGDKELMDIADKIGDLPASMTAPDQSQYYVGYFHQSTEIRRKAERIRIGMMLKEIRERKGYSLRELAEKTGLDNGNISKIEQGRYSVGVDLLSQVASALGVRIDFTDIEG